MQTIECEIERSKNLSTELARIADTFVGAEVLNIDFANLSLSRKGYLRLVMLVIIWLARLNDEERKKLLATELLYGVGERGTYGVCLYDKWVRDGIQDVIEVSAFCGVTPLEIWITVGHELAHVLARRSAAHGHEWKKAACKLGLINPKATGPGCIEDLNPDLVAVLQEIPLPIDGEPICDDHGGTPGKIRTCKVGIGSQDGKSRGPGSGSRLRLYLCACTDPVYRVRIARDDFDATCNRCRQVFRKVEKPNAAPAQPWAVDLVTA